jgi:microcystin-dependent protein
MSFKVVNQAQNVIANKLNYEVVPKMQSHEALQIGDYKLSARNVDYNGWKVCNGRTLSVADYPELYAIIGDDFGVEPEGQFCLPDFTSKVIGMFGLSAESEALTTRNRGQTVGNETIQLTVGQLPPHNHTGTTASNGAHTHGVTDPGHSHNYLGVTGQGSQAGLDSAADNDNRPTQSTSGSFTDISINSAGAHTHTFTSNNTGENDEIDVMQPTLFGVCVMIFAKFVPREQLVSTPW